MGFKIREMSTEGKFCQALTVEALSRAIPPDAIRDVLQQTVAGQTRERKLSLPVVVWLVIALPPDPGGVSGRERHACHRRCGLLALPYQ